MNTEFLVLGEISSFPCLYIFWYLLGKDILYPLIWRYRVTHLLAEKVMLTSVPSQDNLGMSRN